MLSSLVTRIKAAWPVLRWVARLGVLALVLWGLWKAISEAQAKFDKHDFDVTKLHVTWLVASCGFYVLATLPAAWFWHAVLVAMGQRPTWWESLRAYYVGYLGKYVPGKALVVVIRAAMVKSPRVDVGVAAVSVFVETLTLMAVGAVVSAVIIAVLFREQWLLMLIAVGLGVCAGIPTFPPLFRKIIGLFRVAKASPQVAAAVQGLRLGLMSRGWVAMAISWVLMGMSLWATLHALPETTADLNDIRRVLPLLVASISLATVAGFMSLIPGGAFVRELVVIELLKPTFGDVPAIISAVVMRLVSIVSEVLISTILYGIGYLRKPRL